MFGIVGTKSLEEKRSAVQSKQKAKAACMMMMDAACGGWRLAERGVSTVVLLPSKHNNGIGVSL